MSTRATVHRAVAAALALAMLPLAGCSLFRDPRTEAYERLTGARPAVHAAGSVTVDFDVVVGPRDYRRKAYWRGTTRLQYGDRPASETWFTLAAVEQSTLAQPGASRHFEIQSIVSDGLPRAESVRYYLSEDWDTPEGRPWVRIEPGLPLEYGARASGSDDADPGGAWVLVEVGPPGTYVNPDLGLLDPEWYLLLLTSIGQFAVEDPENGRREEIDGVTTDVYEVQCLIGDLYEDDVTDCQFPGEDDQLRQLFANHNISIDVWLDGDNRPRRLAARFLFDNANGVYAAEAELTFRDYGAPVDITPPSADQVTGWPPVP